jgi:hypothetical protein
MEYVFQKYPANPLVGFRRWQDNAGPARMTKRDKPPRPIVRKAGGRLSPVSAWDAELLSDAPEGAEFDLVRRTKRSLPHLRMYFAQLGLIVKATEAFATADHMHEWIKIRLAYTRAVLGPKGEVVGMTVDSAAFDAMDQAAFNVFYEKAARLVAAEMGIELQDVRPGWAI